MGARVVGISLGQGQAQIAIDAIKAG